MKSSMSNASVRVHKYLLVPYVLQPYGRVWDQRNCTRHKICGYNRPLQGFSSALLTKKSGIMGYCMFLICQILLKVCWSYGDFISFGAFPPKLSGAQRLNYRTTLKYYWKRNGRPTYLLHSHSEYGGVLVFRLTFAVVSNWVRLNSNAVNMTGLREDSEPHLCNATYTVKRKCVDSKFWVETQLPPVFERRNTCDWC